jgi:hypothetical protein
LGAPGEAITDGTAVFTELSPVFETNTGFPRGFGPKRPGGSYARVSLAAGRRHGAGGLRRHCESAASTTASTGSGGTTSNNAAITFAAPTANWGIVGAVAVYDALTAGNLLFWVSADRAQDHQQRRDAAPSSAAAALTIQMDD